MNRVIDQYINWKVWYLVELNQKEKIWRDNFIQGYDYNDIGYYRINNNELIEYVLGGSYESKM